MSEKLKQSVDTSHGVALPPGCEIVRRPEGRYLRMPKWLLVSLGSIGLAMLLASCMTPGNTPEPSVLDTIPSPEPTLVEGEETEPEEEMVEIPLPAATETAEPTAEPTDEPSPEPQPTPTVDISAEATRDAILSITGMTTEIAAQIPWVENIANILGSSSSFEVIETRDEEGTVVGYFLEVTGTFEPTSSYNRGDIIAGSPTSSNGYEIFTKWGVVAYDEDVPQAESIPDDYYLVLTDKNTGEVTPTYIPEETIPVWVQEDGGEGLYIAQTQVEEIELPDGKIVPAGGVLFVEQFLYFQQRDLEAAQAAFPGVVRIERLEDGTAIGYDLDGNPIAQEVVTGEGEDEELVWQAYEAPQPVELAPSLTPMEIAQFNPDRDLVVWDETYAQTEGIEYLTDFIFVNPAREDLGLHVSNEGINLDQERFNEGMKLVIDTINEQGIVAIIDKSYVDVTHPDAYTLATNPDGTPRLIELASGDVMAQLSPRENLVTSVVAVFSAQQPVGFSGEQMLSGTWDVANGMRVTKLLSPDGVLTLHTYIPPELLRSFTKDWRNHPDPEQRYDTSWAFPSMLSGPGAGGMLDLAIADPDAVWGWYTVSGSNRAYKINDLQLPPFQDPLTNPASAELKTNMVGTTATLANANDYDWALMFDVFHAGQ